MADLDRKTPPTIKPFSRLVIPQPRHANLDNGVPLTIIDQGNDDVTLLSIVWSGGIAEASSPAITALVALAMREGTTTHSGAEIAETLEFNGAQLSIQPSSHFFRLDLKVVNSRLEYILPTVVEIFRSPAYPEHELNVLRENQARSIEIEYEKVDYHAANAINRLIMGENHPMAFESTPDNIRAITRNDVVAFWEKVFCAKPVHVYLAGHITPEIERLINSHIGSIDFESDAISLIEIPFTAASQHDILIPRPESLQSAVRFAIPTIGRDHPDYTALRLLVMALGGYFGSRLMLNLREDKGYTYGVQAYLLGYREGGVMMISTQCDNSYAQSLIDETRREIERLASRDFTAEEIERLRFNAMSQLASMLDTPFSIIDYYRNHLLSDTPIDYFYQQQEAIEALSSDSLASLAHHLPLSNLYTAIAGKP